MIVLKIIGFVLLGILAVIILALCVKVRIFAEYSEIDTHVNLRWLFLNIPLYPSDKKNKGKKDKKKKNDSKDKDNQESDEAAKTEGVEDSTDAEASSEDEDLENDESEKDETSGDSEDSKDKKKTKKDNSLLKTIYSTQGIDGLLLIVKKTFSYLGTFLGDLLHSLVIDELYIDVKCNKNDAASTAIYYGEVCSALFPMMGDLVTRYKVRKYDINVYPDYLARHSSASFAVNLHLYPIYVIGITFALVFRLLFKVLIGVIVKCIRSDNNKAKAAEKKKTDSTEKSA